REAGWRAFDYQRSGQEDGQKQKRDSRKLSSNFAASQVRLPRSFALPINAMVRIHCDHRKAIQPRTCLQIALKARRGKRTTVGALVEKRANVVSKTQFDQFGGLRRVIQRRVRRRISKVSHHATGTGRILQREVAFASGAYDA